MLILSVSDKNEQNKITVSTDGGRPIRRKQEKCFIDRVQLTGSFIQNLLLLYTSNERAAEQRELGNNTRCSRTLHEIGAGNEIAPEAVLNAGYGHLLDP